MRSWLVGGALVVAVPAMLLVAACGPASHAVPPQAAFQAQGGLRGQILRAQSQSSRPAPDVNPTCNAKPSKLPGNYTVLGAYGHVTGGKFFADLGLLQSGYAVLHYTATNPTPTPTPAPTKTPLYLYVGSYTSTGQAPTKGCFALLTTLTGKPLGGHGSDNASAGGAPIFSQPTNHSTVTAGFIVSLLITGLSPTGGVGTFVLDNGARGTITLTGRIQIDASPHDLVDRALHPDR
jgi:hypothetical protein